MTKISNEAIYTNEDPISENDFVIGTNGDSNAKQTKSFRFANIKAFVNAGLEPITGGTLAITNYDYSGPLQTPEEVVNQLLPNKSILQYEVFIVSVNGTKYITNIQDRIVGDTQPPTNANDFILLSTASSGTFTPADDAIQIWSPCYWTQTNKVVTVFYNFSVDVAVPSSIVFHLPYPEGKPEANVLANKPLGSGVLHRATFDAIPFLVFSNTNEDAFTKDIDMGAAGIKYFSASLSYITP
jgi:hypothetical protein